MEPVAKRNRTNRWRSAAAPALLTGLLLGLAVILATGAATTGIAFVALLLVAASAAIPILVRAPERTDLAGTSGDDDEFTVDGEPDWWPEFERRFADHAAARRRGRRRS